MKCVGSPFRHLTLSQAVSLTECRVIWRIWKLTSGYERLIQRGSVLNYPLARRSTS
jgi:hypothetical protein